MPAEPPTRSRSDCPAILCGIVSEQNGSIQPGILQKENRGERRRAVLAFFRYISTRVVIIAITLAAGIYVAIWVSNLGGYGDQMRKDTIRDKIVQGLMGNEYYYSLSTEERIAYLDAICQIAYEYNDLGKPFYQRSLGYFVDAFSLSLGEARNMQTSLGSKQAKDIILESLPMTLVLFATANLVTFFVSLFLSLLLSRRYGSVLDRLTTLLIPALSAPPWFHGVFLVVIFASIARVMPYGGVVDVPPPDGTLAYVLSFMKHMVLPVAAWVLGTLPLSLYTNRAFFMINAREDYVELAKAKGLRPRRIESRYILRPVLPPVLTNFTFTMIVAWQGAVLTEFVFAWPGVGAVLLTAIRGFEISVTIGAVTVFAYLLGISVLLLDIVYALVDPRVRLGGSGGRE